MSLWWLSFADPHLPKGTQFLGVVMVEADDFRAAMRVVNWTGVNPGGEVQGNEFPGGPGKFAPYMGRLLSRADIDAMDEALKGVADV